ncbi:MAG: hypothetical protein CBD94_01705 [Gammaproteobacteria bacterium TMED234]|jgi:hypothetical protein|nr:MAG: hypothetical protein CBD94_01705 [Gammaproteobacteria bacterium TMED234]|tara:strand:+ start:2028 stop:2255 length:228 start_codon:yes stop_codon:yes gene_type:complete
MNGSEHVNVSLTLEDEFTLTRIKNAAYDLKGRDREQYLWNRIVRLVCRERAFKFIVDELGVVVDPNISVFEEIED